MTARQIIEARLGRNLPPVSQMATDERGVCAGKATHQSEGIEPMTIEEIQTALGELVAAMVEKKVITPRAQIHVPDSGKFAIHCDCKYVQKPFDRQNYFVERGGTIAECIDKARAYIAALPSPEEAAE